MTCVTVPESQVTSCVVPDSLANEVGEAPLLTHATPAVDHTYNRAEPDGKVKYTPGRRSTDVFVSRSCWKELDVCPQRWDDPEDVS
jgi:hypothetical protein